MFLHFHIKTRSLNLNTSKVQLVVQKEREIKLLRKRIQITFLGLEELRKNLIDDWYKGIKSKGITELLIQV